MHKRDARIPDIDDKVTSKATPVRHASRSKNKKQPFTIVMIPSNERNAHPFLY
jgi:hypothetical protein